MRHQLELGLAYHLYGYIVSQMELQFRVFSVLQLPEDLKEETPQELNYPNAIFLPANLLARNL